MNVAIVGGGNASLVLIDYFQSIDYIVLKAVVDLNDDAPGIVRARKLGIKTYKDIAVLKDMPDIETIIELTGNTKVKQLLLDQLKPHQHFMSSNAARIMSDSIEVQSRQRAEMTKKLSQEFTNITSRLRSSEEYISQSIKRIQEVLRSMTIVTMNARIEAARAGQSGRAFEVVVQAMQGTLENIQTALGNITTASDESKSTMVDLAHTEEKLKATLSVR